MSLRVMGKSAAGAPVYGGTFQLVDGEGIALEVILMSLKELGAIHDWCLFALEAMSAGWTPRTIRARAVASCADVYGVQHAEAVGQGLDRVFSAMGALTRR